MSAQRQTITSSVSPSQSLNQDGNNDLVVPTITNTICSNHQITTIPSIKNKNKNKNKQQSTFSFTMKNQPTSTTPSPNNINLQSSTKSFFSTSPSDGSTMKYQGKAHIPIPSSTVVSSDIAPDPAISSLLQSAAKANTTDWIPKKEENAWKFKDSDVLSIGSKQVDQQYGKINNEQKEDNTTIVVATSYQLVQPTITVVNSNKSTSKPLPSVHGDTLESWESEESYQIKAELPSSNSNSCVKEGIFLTSSDYSLIEPSSNSDFLFDIWEECNQLLHQIRQNIYLKERNKLLIAMENEWRLHKYLIPDPHTVKQNIF